jgi:hypothetical protein
MKVSMIQPARPHREHRGRARCRLGSRRAAAAVEARQEVRERGGAEGGTLGVDAQVELESKV